MKVVALVIGFLFSLVGVACVMLVAFASISAGVWGLGHVGPILFIGIPALAVGIPCLLFGARTAQS
jgi:hypothetical protein